MGETGHEPKFRVKHRSFDDTEKYGANNPILFINIFLGKIGKRGFKFLSLWGRSCWADTLVGQLDWGRTHLNQDIGVFNVGFRILHFGVRYLFFFFGGRCTLSRNYTRKQNSREIFPSTFLERSRFLEKKNVYEPNFAQFFGDVQLAILLTVLMNLPQKMIVLILGGDGP